MSTKSKKLNTRQEQFAHEYMVDGNGTRSATAAGYSAKTAHSMSTALLKNPKVKAYLQKLIDKRNARIDFDADTVLRELAAISTSTFKDFITSDGKLINDLSQLPDHALALVSEITETETPLGVKRTIKLHSKLTALGLAGKHVKVKAFEDDTGARDVNIIVVSGIEGTPGGGKK